MDNKGVFMLSNENYQERKEEIKSKLMNLGSDVWNLVCKGFSKTPPSGEELQNNNVALNESFGNILDSTLGKIMHYETAKEVWDNLQKIEEGKTKKACSIGNLLSK